MGNLDGEINQTGGSFKALLDIIVFYFYPHTQLFSLPTGAVD